MRYKLLKPYPVFEVISGEPLTTEECSLCRRKVRLGENRLAVTFVDDPPYPDAIAAMEGPEWAASGRLRSFLLVLAPEAIKFVPIAVNDEVPDFMQAVIKATLPAGKTLIRGGQSCNACGQGVQLNDGPVFLSHEPDDGPKVARLLENPYLILVRADIAAQLMERGVDIELEEVFFDGETPPRSAQTFEGVDWSDI